MGLMDEAVTTAHTQAARHAAAMQNNERAIGVDFAEHLHKAFDLPVEYLDRVQVVDYHKNYSDFGGMVWKRRERTLARFQIDDVIIGADIRDGKIKEGFYVWRVCPTCGQKVHTSVRYVPTWTDRPDKVDEQRRALIAGIGHALTNTDECTACQARPCECCGRT